MEAKNLRWVFCVLRGNVTYFLADENNNPLGFPFLRYLSKEEQRLLDNLGIRCSTDPCNSYYFDVSPKKPSERVMITAPAYIEVHNGEGIEFCKVGTYTGESESLRDCQFVNETVLANIPQSKIHFGGNYVPVAE